MDSNVNERYLSLNLPAQFKAFSLKVFGHAKPNKNLSDWPMHPATALGVFNNAIILVVMLRLARSVFTRSSQQIQKLKLHSNSNTLVLMPADLKCHSLHVAPSYTNCLDGTRSANENTLDKQVHKGYKSEFFLHFHILCKQPCTLITPLRQDRKDQSIRSLIL